MSRHLWRFALAVLLVGGLCPLASPAPAAAAPAAPEVPTYSCTAGMSKRVCTAIKLAEDAYILGGLQAVTGLDFGGVLAALGGIAELRALGNGGQIDPASLGVCTGTCLDNVENIQRIALWLQQSAQRLKEAEKLDQACEFVGWWLDCELPAGAQNVYGEELVDAGVTHYFAHLDTIAGTNGLPLGDVALGPTTGQTWSITAWLQPEVFSAQNRQIFSAGAATPSAYWSIGNYFGTGTDWALRLVRNGAAAGQYGLRSSWTPGLEGDEWGLLALTWDGTTLSGCWQAVCGSSSTFSPGTVFSGQVYYGGYAPAIATGSQYMWNSPMHQVAVHMGTVLTLGQITALRDIYVGNPTGVEEDEALTEIPEELPPRPGTEEVPTPTTEASPSTTTIPAPPPSITVPANPTGTHEEQQTGLLQQIKDGISGGFNWLGDRLGGLLGWIGERLLWLGDIFGYWIRWLWERLNGILGSIRTAINAVGDTLIWVMTVVRDAILSLGQLLGTIAQTLISIPALIATALRAILEELFVPSDDAFDFSTQQAAITASPLGGAIATVGGVPDAFGALTNSCGSVGPEAYGSKVDLCRWSDAGLDFGSGGAMPNLMMRILEVAVWLAVVLRIIRTLPWSKGRDAGEPVAA